MIVDEVNYFKRIYNEKQLNKKTLIKQWRIFELTGTGSMDLEMEKKLKAPPKKKPKLQKNKK